MSAKLERFHQAYLAMAKQAKYRPQAPSDGCGNIQLTKEQCADKIRLNAEATAYALAFDREEDSLQFWIGCSNFSTNRAFVFAIEAARVLASDSDGNPVAQKLLEMAVAEIRDETKCHR